MFLTCITGNRDRGKYWFLCKSMLESILIRIKGMKITFCHLGIIYSQFEPCLGTNKGKWHVSCVQHSIHTGLVCLNPTLWGNVTSKYVCSWVNTKVMGMQYLFTANHWQDSVVKTCLTFTQYFSFFPVVLSLGNFITLISDQCVDALTLFSMPKLRKLSQQPSYFYV